ncbi:MAG: redoxin domain-containing protein [Inquilinaceae bacterium]
MAGRRGQRSRRGGQAPASRIAPAAATSGRATLLAAGDRVPDFLLPDQNKAVDPFYDLVGGGPVVLHFHPGGGRPEWRAARDGLAARFDVLRDRGVEVFAVSTDTLAANCVQAKEDALPFPLLTDPAGRVHGLCGVPVHEPGSGDADVSIVTFVLDANQRVEHVFQGDGPGHADRVVAALEATVPADAPALVTRAAPVLLIPNVLDRAACQRLMTLWRTGGNRPSGTLTMGQGGAEARADRAEVKRRRDHHVQDPALFAELTQQVFGRVAPEVKRAFDCDLERVEEFKIVRYDSEEGGFFRPHRDNSIPARAQRRFAMTLNLNDGYEGGHLRFPEYGPQLYRPRPGEAVIFSCAVLHEATDVTAGERFVLLSFLLDGTPDHWRQERRQWFQNGITTLEKDLARQAGRGAS